MSVEKKMLEKYDIVKQQPDFYDDVVNESIEVKSDNAVITTASQVRLHYRDGNSLIDLSDSYLQFQYLETGESIRLNHQGGAMSLWSRAVLRINNVIVESVDYANFVAMVKHNLIYSKDYLASQGSNMGIKAVATARAEALGTKEYFVPLHSVFGFCSINKIVSGEITLELTRGNILQYGLRKTNNVPVAHDINVQKCSLWLNRVRPHPVVDNTVKSLMASNVASEFVFPSYNAYYTGSLNSGQSQRILTSSERILHAFVVCLDETTDNDGGDANATARWTQGVLKSNNNIRQLTMRLNGTASPTIAYTDLNTHGKSRAYGALFRLLSGGDYMGGIGLSRAEYDNLAIVPFDFRGSPQNLSGSPSVLELEINNADASERYLVVVQTEKSVEVNYSGGQAIVRVH